MRRLLPILIAAVALLLPAAASAAKPVVVDGAAHRAGSQVKGWFAFEATGSGQTPRRRVAISLGDGREAKVAGRLQMPSFEAGTRRRFHFSRKVPAGLHGGQWRIRACLPGQCLRIGEFSLVAGTGGGSPGTTPKGAGGRPATPTSPPSSAPISTVPTAPLTYKAGTPFHVVEGGTDYWAFVPYSYDKSNQTATPLLVWLHGCGGYSEGDIWVVDPGADGETPQDWLTIAVGGREGGCWNPLGETEPTVMAALANVETHFNVDRRRVILGGYSSGGDLAYRTGFRHSSTFAGLLIENSSPFRDTEASAAESLAAATTKLHIVHLAHTGDTTYPIGGVRKEVGEVAAAGFPIELIERPGTHYDPHTDPDLIELLLPHIDDGRLAPTP
jgi:hypothetical protein